MLILNATLKHRTLRSKVNTLDELDGYLGSCILPGGLILGTCLRAYRRVHWRLPNYGICDIAVIWLPNKGRVHRTTVRSVLLYGPET